MAAGRVGNTALRWSRQRPDAGRVGGALVERLQADEDSALLLCAMPSSMLKPTTEVMVATPGVARSLSSPVRLPMCG